MGKLRLPKLDETKPSVTLFPSIKEQSENENRQEEPPAKRPATRFRGSRNACMTEAVCVSEDSDEGSGKVLKEDSDWEDENSNTNSDEKSENESDGLEEEERSPSKTTMKTHRAKAPKCTSMLLQPRKRQTLEANKAALSTIPKTVRATVSATAVPKSSSTLTTARTTTKPMKKRPAMSSIMNKDSISPAATLKVRSLPNKPLSSLLGQPYRKPGFYKAPTTQ